MDIVIIANFCMDFSRTDNGRFRYIANMLAKEHNVEIITSSFYHITKSQREEQPEQPFKVTLIDEPGYRKNICLKRFYSHYVWGHNVKRYLEKRKKPDVIYCAIPSLNAPLVAAKYCEKNKIRFIIDVQDLWPEAFQLVFNLPIVSDMIFFPFKQMAKGIYKRADEVVAVSQTYAERALKDNKKDSKAHSVFLGTDLEIFDSHLNKTSIYSKKETEIWLAYCGTLGSSYDLTSVLRAVHKTNITNLKFIVMGDGPLMEKFQLLAEELKINVKFTGRLSYDMMCCTLSQCDICINPIMSRAAQSIINKHADYVASGLPIINTQDTQEFRNLISQYNCGINCKNADENDIANAITKLCEDKDLRIKMGKNSRKLAAEKFNRAETYKEIIELIANQGK